MRKLFFVFVAMLAFSSMHANSKLGDECVVNPSPNTERIQATGKPLVSTYIVDFIMSGSYYIAYQEPGKAKIFIYCNATTFESLCRDYDLMQELALNVKWGKTSYKDYCTMEAKFEKKYTYAKNSKNVYWITMSK